MMIVYHNSLEKGDFDPDEDAVTETLDGFYRNNQEAVHRIYNTHISVKKDYVCYCIRVVPFQGFLFRSSTLFQCIFKPAKRACQRKPQRCVTVTASLSLLLLLLSCNLSNTVKTYTSSFTSSQSQHKQLKSGIQHSMPFARGSEHEHVVGQLEKGQSSMDHAQVNVSYHPPKDEEVLPDAATNSSAQQLGVNATV
jgi:hypothetical protein